MHIGKVTVFLRVSKRLQILARLFWVMYNRLCKIEHELAVFADQEVTLGHELISRSKFDIGKVTLRPCDYCVVRISNALLCEPHSCGESNMGCIMAMTDNPIHELKESDDL